MKSVFKKSSFLSFVLVVISLSFAQNCGKKDDDDKKPAVKPVPAKINNANIDKGNAVFSFDANGSSEPTFCRISTDSYEGEYYRCNGNSVSYPTANTQSVTLYVKVGENGTEVSKTIQVSELPAGSPPSGKPSPTPSTAVVTPDFGGSGAAPSVDTFVFGGNQGFVTVLTQQIHVQPGQYIVKYSDNNTLGGSLRVYEAESNDDPFFRATICQGAGAFPNVATRGVEAQSVANGPIHRYCESSPSQEAHQFMSQRRMNFNHIEVASEKNVPKFEYITATAIGKKWLRSFPNGPLEFKPVEKVKSLFHAQCVTQDNTVINRGTGTLPMKAMYFPGLLPAHVQFHWCKKLVSLGQGMSDYVYIGAFLTEEVGQTEEVIEFTYMSVAAGMEPFEFLRLAGNRALNMVQPALPEVF